MLGKNCRYCFKRNMCTVLLLSSFQNTSSLLDLARIHNFSQTLFQKYCEALLIFLPLFMKVLHYFSFNFLLLIPFFSAFYLTQFWHGPSTIWKKLTDIWNNSKKSGCDVSQNIQVELAPKTILNKGWQCLHYLWELSGWIQKSFDHHPSFLFFYHPWSYPHQHALFYFCWHQGLEGIKALYLCWRRHYW